MEIGKKDGLLGGLLISIFILAGLSGFLGLSLLNVEKGNAPEQTIPGPWGLPDDWSTAYNSSYFTLDNGTDIIKITLGDLLEGITLALDEEENGNGADINEYKVPLYLYTIQDPYSGIYYTGVDILDVLEHWNTNFAYNLSFMASKTPDGFSSVRYLNMSTADIINKMYENDEDPVIIALAANKGWLPGSKLGNFTIVGKNMNESLSNLEYISVLDSWKVDIYVNNTLEYTIDPSNMMTNEYDATYYYEDNDWWSFNRHYWGRNISEIISHTSILAEENYTVRIWSCDNWATPVPSGTSPEKPYNNTDVEEGITPPWNPDKDLVNDPEEPLPESDLLMSLVYADQEFGETGQGITDPIWPYRLMCGYHRGPFYVCIPGRPRRNYLSHVVKIEITVYPGSIPDDL